MNAHILDQFVDQPLYKRSIQHAFTSAAWGVFLYIWSPLLTSSAVYAGFQDSTFPESTQQLHMFLATLRDHAAVVCVVIGIFFVWALVQHSQKGRCFCYTQNDRIELIYIAETLVLAEPELKIWQHTQSIMAFHDEQFGRISYFSINVEQPKREMATKNLLVVA